MTFDEGDDLEVGLFALSVSKATSFSSKVDSCGEPVLHHRQFNTRRPAGVSSEKVGTTMSKLSPCSSTI